MEDTTRRQMLGGLASVATVGMTQGCGFILHPERRNQDKTGMVLDGWSLTFDILWLWVGIIPGVVALVVDFSTNAVYMPMGRAGARRFKKIKVRRGRREDYEKALWEATGMHIRLDDPEMRWLSEPGELTAEELSALAIESDPRLALTAGDLLEDVDGTLLGIEPVA